MKFSGRKTAAKSIEKERVRKGTKYVSRDFSAKFNRAIRADGSGDGDGSGKRKRKRNRGHLSPRKEEQVEKRRNCSRSIWKSPSKVKPASFSRAYRYSTAKKAVRRSRLFFPSLSSPFLSLVFFKLVASFLFCIFMKSSWAARSKGLGLVAWVCRELHFCWYRECRERSIHKARERERGRRPKGVPLFFFT